MRILLSFILLFFVNLSFGQWNWPVQVNTITTGPYYNYLSYYSDQNDHMQIMVTLTDPLAASVPAKLRIRIEGPGYWIETKPYNNITPLTLEPFTPNVISGIELAPYFYESNIDKSSNDLNINNLPEGYTNVCVEVIGVGGTLTTIGGNQCAPFWLQRFQPPQATLPVCESTVDTSEIFHIFQWTPPIGYVPTISSELSYTFSLYEWVDPNNYTIFQTGQGLVYQTSTDFNTIQLSDFDVQLQIGMQYVWRIQSKLTDNGMPVNMFENNGLSEICTFTYGESLSLEEQLADGLYINLETEPSTSYKGRAYWTVFDNSPGIGLPNYDRFYIEYRRKPQTAAEEATMIWHSDTVLNPNHFIYQLGPDETYQVRVSGIIGNVVNDPTPIEEFTTPPEVEYPCGDQQQPYRPDNYVSNENVLAGDRVQIGQFVMTISEVLSTGTLGRYEGKGEIPIDFLGGAKAKVTFDDILIDTEFFVREGRVDVVTKGLDAWLDEQYMQFIEPTYVDGTIDSAWVDTTSGSGWIIVDGVAQEFTFTPSNYPTSYNDESGYTWTIWPNGTVTVEGYLDYSNDYLDVTADAAVIFEQKSDEKFGFDGKEFMQWHENYEIIQLSDSSNYFVSNKSIGQSQTDGVIAIVPNNVSASFKLDDQTSISASSNGNTYTLQIPQIAQTGSHTIYAYDGATRIGKLNLHVYKPKAKNIVIVPVANVSIDTAQLHQKLKNTLGEANITFNLTLENQWNNNEFSPTANIDLPTDVGVLSKYSSDMKNLRDAYFDDTSVTVVNDAYYLFVVAGFDDSSTDGYMVRGKALGFVQAGSDYLTYAHELAHGLGALEHSWKNNGPPEGGTDNLMDYALNADNLIKEQWKELRDKDFVPSMWDDADDFMQTLQNLNYEVNAIQIPTNPYSGLFPIENFDADDVFRSPNNINFSLGDEFEKVTEIHFNDGKVDYFKSGSKFLMFIGEAHYTDDTDDGEAITSTVNTVIYLCSAVDCPRQSRNVSKDGTQISLCDQYFPDDLLTLNFPKCEDYSGQYIIGIQNGTPLKGSINCPPEGECDAWPLESYTQQEKQVVKEAFRKIILSSGGSFSNYKPIEFIDGKNYTLGTEDQRVIKEKLRTLNQLRPNLVVGYVSMNGFSKNLMTQETADSLAEQVVADLAIDFPGKQLVLYFNHNITGIKEGLFTIEGFSCQTASFATNTPDIVSPNFVSQDLSTYPDAANSFLALFRELKKPFYITTIYEKYDGSIAYRSIDRTSDPLKDVYGIPYTYGARHLVSKNKAEYDNYTAAIGGALQAIDFQGDVLTFQGPGMTPEEAQESYLQLVNELPQKDNVWKQESFENMSDWIPGEIEFDNIKEHFLTTSVALSEFNKERNLTFLKDLALVVGGTVGNLNVDVYYEFDPWEKVIDPIVYGGLDIVGLPLSLIGADVITDGLGAVYAAARGDGLQFTIYSASIVIPFTGSYVVHSGTKVYSYYAKHSANDLAEIAVKNLDEAQNLGDDWVKISNDIPYNDANVVTIRQELEANINQIDNTDARKVVELKGANLADNWVGSNLLTKLDELNDAALKQKFLDDFLVVPDEVKSILNQNVDLVDSWKVLSDQPNWVRTNIDLLSDLVGKSDEFIDRVNMFYNNLALPANLPKNLPSTITHNFNGQPIIVSYNKYGFPEFGVHMTTITDNGVNVAKTYKGTWNQITSSHNAARTKDLKDATNWALETDAAGNLVNFPNGRVRRYVTPNGNPSPTKIEILDDNGNWIEQTWHHHENGRNLIPVPSDIHNPLNHSGGFAAKHGPNGTIVTPDTNVTEIFDYEPIIN